MKDSKGRPICRICKIKLIKLDNWTKANAEGGIKNPSTRNIRYICTPCDNHKSFMRRQKQKAIYNPDNKGCVYALSNPAYKGWIKIGRTNDIKQRISSYQTGTPFSDYVIESQYTFDEYKNAEANIHAKLSSIYKERIREWYKVDVSKVKDIMRDEYNETISQ